MKRLFVTVTILALMLMFLGSANAGDWIDEDTYEAPTGEITVDGDPDDWRFVDLITESEFKTDGGEWVVFEEYNGGTWDGPEDHTSSIAFAWDEDYLYIFTSVVDDEHQNNASWYDGDAAQLVFSDPDQAVVTQLYNYANVDGEDEILIGNEQATAGGLTDDDVAIVRYDNKNITIYEARYSPEILGLSSFDVGTEIGIGICINDGDKDTPGQKGWSGWGPHAAVFGKNANKTGLVTLSDKTISVDSVGKLPIMWGALK